MDEIRWISYANEAICIWNLPDFMKSTGFHDEIRRISCMKSARFHAWNLPDFMKFARFHEIHRIPWICQISCMKSTGFHEIHWISWNPPDFMKSTKFHAWNLPDFMKFIGFHEIHQISWNLPNFMHEIRRISWNSLDFMKSAGFHVFPKWAKDQWSYFLSMHGAHHLQNYLPYEAQVTPSLGKTKIFFILVEYIRYMMNSRVLERFPVK